MCLLGWISNSFSDLVSEYDQEMPQSHTTDQLMALPGRDKEHWQSHNRTLQKQSNQLSLPQQDDCRTRKHIKINTTTQRPTTKKNNHSCIDTMNLRALVQYINLHSALHSGYLLQLFKLPIKILISSNLIGWIKKFYTPRRNPRTSFLLAADKICEKYQ